MIFFILYLGSGCYAKEERVAVPIYLIEIMGKHLKNRVKTISLIFMSLGKNGTCVNLFLNSDPLKNGNCRSFKCI